MRMTKSQYENPQIDNSHKQRRPQRNLSIAAIHGANQEKIEQLANQVQINIALGRFDLAKLHLAEAEQLASGRMMRKVVKDVLIADLEINSSMRTGNTLQEIGLFTVGDFLTHRSAFDVVTSRHMGLEEGVYFRGKKLRNFALTGFNNLVLAVQKLIDEEREAGE